MTWASSAIEAFRRRYGQIADAALGATAWHPHDAADISGVYESINVHGDIWSTDWNGAVPADLSTGRDPTATQGFYMDSSAGVIQAMGLYWAAGPVSPLATGSTWLWETGAALPTTQATICSTPISEGIVANGYYLVDIRVTLQASAVVAGADWWVQALVQDAVVGMPIMGARVATGTTSGSVGVSGTSGNASSDHNHAATGISVEGSGTLSHEHTISGATHDHTITCSGGHTDNANVKTHDHTGSTTGSTLGSHNHALSGSTYGQSVTHNHTVTCYGSCSGSCSAGLARGQVSLSAIVKVRATAGGVITLGVQAGTQTSPAHVDKVQIAYMIWNAPVPPAVELTLLQPLSLYAPTVSNT